MEKITNKLITVQVVIKASISRVWNSWIDPKHIVNWNFASDEWCCPKAINDFKEEGKFVYRMEAKNQSVGFNFIGIYKKIVEEREIVYEIEDGREVKIAFIENEKEVVLKETFEAEGSNSDEQQRAGWQAILENFKKYVEM